MREVLRWSSSRRDRPSRKGVERIFERKKRVILEREKVRARSSEGERVRTREKDREREREKKNGEKGERDRKTE